MTTIGLAEARAQLPKLVERAASGEVIVITRKGKPVARIVPLDITVHPVDATADDAAIAAATSAGARPLTIDATPVNRSVAPRNASPRPSASSNARLAPQPPGLTMLDIIKAGR